MVKDAWEVEWKSQTKFQTSPGYLRGALNKKMAKVGILSQPADSNGYDDPDEYFCSKIF